MAGRTRCAFVTPLCAVPYARRRYIIDGLLCCHKIGSAAVEVTTCIGRYARKASSALRENFGEYCNVDVLMKRRGGGGIVFLSGYNS